MPLSLTTVGGGQSVVAEIHRQAVNEYHWMTDGQFLDDFALSRLSPGPGSLLVSLVGWQVAGILGAVVASFAIFAPSSFLVYWLARIWTRYRGARWQIAVERGLAPLAAGMILAASLTVLRAAQGGWIAWGVAAGVDDLPDAHEDVAVRAAWWWCGGVFDCGFFHGEYVTARRKKRSIVGGHKAKWIKVFWFFFSKKNS